jgi:transcriptional regulator with XRE-family HTH domain
MAELADLASVSKPTIWAWENGKSSPREERIPELARILHVAESELMEGISIGGLPEGDRTALLTEIAQSKAKIAALVGTSADQIEINIRF